MVSSVPVSPSSVSAAVLSSYPSLSSLSVSWFYPAPFDDVLSSYTVCASASSSSTALSGCSGSMASVVAPLPTLCWWVWVGEGEPGAIPVPARVLVLMSGSSIARAVESRVSISQTDGLVPGRCYNMSVYASNAVGAGTAITTGPIYLPGPCDTTPPCANGGTCTHTHINSTSSTGSTCSAGYVCACLPGWLGVNCTVVDWCFGHGCTMGSTCVRGSNAYICQCAVGYTGANCSVIDQCWDSPCRNGGTCTSALVTYSCVCPSTHFGTNCTLSCLVAPSSPLSVYAWSGPGYQQVSVRWVAPTSPLCVPALTYTVLSEPVRWNVTVGSATLTYTFGGVDTQQLYAFRIVASHGTASSIPSALSNAVIAQVRADG